MQNNYDVNITIKALEKELLEVEGNNFLQKLVKAKVMMFNAGLLHQSFNP